MEGFSDAGGQRARSDGEVIGGLAMMDASGMVADKLCRIVL